MKKYCEFGIVIMLCLFLVSGCGANQDAMKMQKNGVWEQRNKSFSQNDAGKGSVNLTINVKKDMTEKEMLKVLDYYEHDLKDKKNGAPFDTSGEILFYAIFYQGDTNEIIKKYKYCNGKSMEITKDDESTFYAIDKTPSSSDE